MFNQSIMTNMKRTMMMALMAVAATTAFAQDALVKDAKKLLGKGDFDSAAKVLVPALTSSETLDKAAAWNLQSEIMYGKFSALQTQEMESKVKQTNTPFDTLAMTRDSLLTGLIAKNMKVRRASEESRMNTDPRKTQYSSILIMVISWSLRLA